MQECNRTRQFPADAPTCPTPLDPTVFRPRLPNGALGSVCLDEIGHVRPRLLLRSCSDLACGFRPCVGPAVLGVNKNRRRRSASASLATKALRRSSCTRSAPRSPRWRPALPQSAAEHETSSAVRGAGSPSAAPEVRMRPHGRCADDQCLKVRAAANEARRGPRPLQIRAAAGKPRGTWALRYVIFHARAAKGLPRCFPNPAMKAGRKTLLPTTVASQPPFSTASPA